MEDENASSVKTEDVENKEKKRKISALSSVSEIELDTSGSSPVTTKTKKKKKSRNKSGKGEKNPNIETEHKDKESKMAGEQSPEITRQLTEINKKLSNVITKGDGTLREMIKEVFQQMKDEFLHSVSHRIDILEGKLFEKEKENDSLKKTISKLQTEIDNRKTEIEDQKAENSKLQAQIEKSAETANGKINDLEQYGRRNNLKISGLPESEGDETAEMTTGIVIDKLNNVIGNLNLRREDIDIAHRLGPKRNRRWGQETAPARRVIIKFNSRIKRDNILRNRKLFKGTDIFVNEDLTQINQNVLACVRKKMPDEVKQSWSINGRIFYESQTGEKIEVKYCDFQEWVDLPWPVNEHN